MSAEREGKLALRWGLVGLGALGYTLVRASIALLNDWISITLPKVRPGVLAQRMSQLKPVLWKAAHLQGYAIALLILCCATLAAMLALSVRAFRDRSDPPRVNPPG